MFELSDELIFSFISVLLGFIYGFIAQRKQFCFSGGIKDIILFKHTRRTASLIVAISTAIIFTQLFSYLNDIDLTQTRYYLNINYLFIILGGLMFGYGMMISDGCSSRHLIKASQGEKESFYILLSLGLFSYITYTLLSNFYTDIYSNKIIEFTTVETVVEISLFLVIPILFYLLYLSLKKCMNFFQVLDGFVIGILVTIGWIVTTTVSSELFIDTSPQSLSFVYPLGRSIEFIKSGFDTSYLNFAVFVIFGVVSGAVLSSRFNKKYSKKFMCDNSQQNPPSLAHKLIGGAFMGVGGILAVGCTVGQGLSGLSSLSVASFLAIFSIYVSGYITAKYMHKNNALIACFVFDFDCKK